jgi:hypothetical protein
MNADQVVVRLRSGAGGRPWRAPQHSHDTGAPSVVSIVGPSRLQPLRPALTRHPIAIQRQSMNARSDRVGERPLPSASMPNGCWRAGAEPRRSRPWRSINGTAAYPSIASALCHRLVIIGARHGERAPRRVGLDDLNLFTSRLSGYHLIAVVPPAVLVSPRTLAERMALRSTVTPCMLCLGENPAQCRGYRRGAAPRFRFTSAFNRPPAGIRYLHVGNCTRPVTCPHSLSRHSRKAISNPLASTSASGQPCAPALLSNSSRRR